MYAWQSAFAYAECVWYDRDAIAPRKLVRQHGHGACAFSRYIARKHFSSGAVWKWNEKNSSLIGFLLHTICNIYGLANAPTTLHAHLKNVQCIEFALSFSLNFFTVFFVCFCSKTKKPPMILSIFFFSQMISITMPYLHTNTKWSDGERERERERRESVFTVCSSWLFFLVGRSVYADFSLSLSIWSVNFNWIKNQIAWKQQAHRTHNH